MHQNNKTFENSFLVRDLADRTSQNHFANNVKAYINLFIFSSSFELRSILIKS
jgi:hypothetical protein